MSNQLIITGLFLAAGPLKTTLNGYSYRDFWVDMTDNPQYPNTPQLTLGGDRCTLVDNLKPGQRIEVRFGIEGRKYTKADGKKGVITNLKAYAINVIQTTSAAFVPSQMGPNTPSGGFKKLDLGADAPSETATAPMGHSASNIGDDDLPF